MKGLFITIIISVSSLFSYSQNIFTLIENNDYDKVKEYTKSLNIYNSEHTTPLMQAIYKSDLKMVKLLVSKGADPKKKSFLKVGNYLSGSNFVLAAWTGKIDILKYLLKKKYFTVDECEYEYYNKEVKDGWNALHTAVYNNDTIIIRFLVKHGADINYVSEVDNNKTPLLNALRYDKIEAAVELINMGADVNIRDEYYDSTMYLALETKNRKLVKLIYKNGFKFNEKRKERYLEIIKKMFNIESFEML